MTRTEAAELDQLELAFSTTNYTMIIPQSHEESRGEFIAVSKHKVIVTSEETLYLVQKEEDTSRIMAK